MNVSEPFLVTVAETQRLLSIGLTKCYELISDGTLETVKIGRSTRVKMESIKRFCGTNPDYFR